MAASAGGESPRHLSPDEFRDLGRRFLDWIFEYQGGLEAFPVLSEVAPGDTLARLPESPPEEGLGDSGWSEVLADLDDVVAPGVTHWQSPRFFGYFPCNGSGPGVLAELVSAALNVQGMLWQTSPSCTELETRMLDWMAEAFGLPEAFRSTSASGGGVIQGTASEATLVALCASRRRVLREDPEADLVAYASTQAHSSVVKAAMIAGLARDPEDGRHLRLIEPDDGLRLSCDGLAQAMREDLEAGRRPFYVCATMGTTSSGAVDPVDRIAEVVDDVWRSGGRRGPRPWIHVDGAWAGAALVCPEFRGMARGLEHADSVCVNPHKWLLTNFDCDLFWTRDRQALIDALSVTPEYLRNPASDSGEVIDYRDWQVPLGRRFRSLKLWFVVRHYGLRGLRAHVREHARLAELFEGWVREDARFEPAAKRSLSLVCFRLKASSGEGSAEQDRLNRELLRRLNESGRVFLTHTVLPTPDGPRVALRMSIGGTLTREAHVREAWGLIAQHADVVLSGAE